MIERMVTSGDQYRKTVADAPTIRLSGGEGPLEELRELHGAKELPDTGIEVCETCLVLYPCRTAELVEELAR
jgi:hypothetical protein